MSFSCPSFPSWNNPVLKLFLSGASKASNHGRVEQPKKGKEDLPTEEAATVMGDQLHIGALISNYSKDNGNQVSQCQENRMNPKFFY